MRISDTIGKFIASLLIVGLAVCTQPVRAGADTLSHITSSKTLRVGVAVYPPFVEKNTQTGELQGFDIDSARMLAKQMGVRVDFVEMTWGTLVAGLDSGRYDVIMSGMARTIQRAMAVSFTDPVFSLVELAMVRTDTGVNNWSNISSGTRPVAAVLGGATFLLASANNRGLGSAPLRPFPDLASAGNAVIAKQAIAWIEDVISISQFMKAHPGAPLKTIDVDFLGRGPGNGYAVRQGDTNLLNVLNIFIYQMQNDGTYRALAKKWGLPEKILVPGIMEGR